MQCIATGLHLAGAARLLAPLDALGAPFWRLGRDGGLRPRHAKLVRALAGTAVLAFGIYGLAHGADLRSLLCL